MLLLIRGRSEKLGRGGRRRRDLTIACSVRLAFPGSPSFVPFPMSLPPGHTAISITARNMILSRSQFDLAVLSMADEIPAAEWGTPQCFLWDCP